MELSLPSCFFFSHSPTPCECSLIQDILWGAACPWTLLILAWCSLNLQPHHWGVIFLCLPFSDLHMIHRHSVPKFLFPFFPPGNQFKKHVWLSGSWANKLTMSSLKAAATEWMCFLVLSDLELFPTQSALYFQPSQAAWRSVENTAVKPC